MEYVAIEVSLSHHLIPTMDFVWTKQLVHGYKDVAHSRNLPNLNKNNKQVGVVSVVVIVMDVVVIAMGVVSIVVDVVGAKEGQRLSVRESLSSVNEV